MKKVDNYLEKVLKNFDEKWEAHQRFCSHYAKLVRVCDSNCKNVFERLFSESIEQSYLEGFQTGAHETAEQANEIHAVELKEVREESSKEMANSIEVSKQGWMDQSREEEKKRIGKLVCEFCKAIE